MGEENYFTENCFGDTWIISWEKSRLVSGLVQEAFEYMVNQGV